uniref:NADH-ubiquinone oxidoreductase chain 4L n=1 Tax=Rhinotermes hispidus TaxID=280684 RepID=A0A3G1DJD8_9NEOP|nr:NADH dehydrogenase subunit 4L [Rhinotermes hispidus]AMX23115.1 NADH dehydrogenase subunit 4L [Rhinotermes hispidus]URH16771.1 NADH dehydrogenase subunit 4L [Rhinotermes hispidus]
MLMCYYLGLLYFCGVWSFTSNRSHLLSTLLSLEFIVLALYLFLYYYFCSFSFNLYFVVYFLVFSVCESSLGLSILVSMIRSHGNDYFQSYSVLQC